MFAALRTTQPKRCSCAPDPDGLAVGSQGITSDIRKKARWLGLLPCTDTVTWQIPFPSILNTASKMVFVPTLSWNEWSGKLVEKAGPPVPYSLPGSHCGEPRGGTVCLCGHPYMWGTVPAITLWPGYSCIIEDQVRTHPHLLFEQRSRIERLWLFHCHDPTLRKTKKASVSRVSTWVHTKSGATAPFILRSPSFFAFIARHF